MMVINMNMISLLFLPLAMPLILTIAMSTIAMRVCRNGIDVDLLGWVNDVRM